MADDAGGGGYHLHNILTGLAVRVGQIEGTLKTFMDNWATQDKLAHDARRIVYERIDLVGRQVERVATDVQGMQQDIAELKKEVDEDVAPTIKAFEHQRARKMGAKGVWTVLGSAVVAVASALAYVLDKIASYVIPKP